jgi:hypothetical protein
MKTYGQDILTSQKELKERPFSVPDGYFEAFKADVVSKNTITAASPLRRMVPYIAAAASLTLLFGVGLSLNKSFKTRDVFSTEDYILFSDSMIHTIYDNNASTYQYADAELMDEDIIEYLIYTGESPESIELSK